MELYKNVSSVSIPPITDPFCFYIIFLLSLMLFTFSCYCFCISTNCCRCGVYVSPIVLFSICFCY